MQHFYNGHVRELRELFLPYDRHYKPLIEEGLAKVL